MLPAGTYRRHIEKRIRSGNTALPSIVAMDKTQRPLATLALIAISALVSACGSHTTAGSTTAAHAQAMRFAACMRSNGVGGFPDPSGSGGFTIDAVVNGSSLNPNAPAFKHAISTCRGLEPAGFTGPKVTARQMAVRLEFARCIRRNGVPDFPDPTASGPLVDTNRIPSAKRPGGMSALTAAMHECGALYAGELGLGKR
jgi:hypothetical protein